MTCYSLTSISAARFRDEIARAGCITIAGGPHATALPAEMLQWCAELDTVIIGEGEETFLELISRLEQGGATAGIPGTAWRAGALCAGDFPVENAGALW